MTDRELLEAAAKAEGHACPWMLPDRGGERPWNPLTDDGDALRLAVALRMEVTISPAGHTWADDRSRRLAIAKEMHNHDPAAATRRAIVRAAAALSGGDAP